jgi:hypothetical protein
MARAGAFAFDLTGRAYFDSLAQAFMRFLLWHLIASSNIKVVIYGICDVRSTPCVQFCQKTRKNAFQAECWDILQSTLFWQNYGNTGYLSGIGPVRSRHT